MPIAVKIDVTKIDKARLFPGRNGAKYLDVILIDREDDYGNHYMACQSVSKEEREQGVKGPILGNGKNLGKPSGGRPTARQPQRATESFGEDVPF